MTPQQWADITGRVEALWGKSQAWAKADVSYEYARDVTAKAANSAIDAMFHQGRDRGPSPAALLAAARSISGTPTTTERPAPDDCDHAWSPLPHDYETDICRHCHTERPAPIDAEVI